MDRDEDRMDHFRFAPIQTPLAQTLCTKYNLPNDVSTAILLDDNGKCYIQSDSVLRLFLYLGPMYRWMALLALTIFPKWIRDAGYRLFAKYRGTIWKVVKKVCRMGDVQMEPYRDRVVGLDDNDDELTSLNASWGFSSNKNKNNKKKES